MKKILLVSGLLIIAVTGAFGQKSKVNTASSASSSAKASGSAGNSTATLESGTQIAGQLQSALDAKNAKVGDQVVLKTTSAIKQNGQVVVQKGAKLIGHVTDVQQKAKGNAMSKVGVLFDTLQQGGSSLPINAVITSVTQARTAANIGGDDIGASGSGMSSTSASTSQSSGGSGLLGGVGNTVGGVVNATTQTVGGVANTAGQTLGSTTQAVGETLRGIQITQSTDASASGGSTLSLGGGNLHLDKGTTINLSLSQSTSVKTN